MAARKLALTIFGAFALLVLIVANIAMQYSPGRATGATGVVAGGNAEGKDGIIDARPLTLSNAVLGDAEITKIDGSELSVKITLRNKSDQQSVTIALGPLELGDGSRRGSPGVTLQMFTDGTWIAPYSVMIHDDLKPMLRLGPRERASLMVTFDCFELGLKLYRNGAPVAIFLKGYEWGEAAHGEMLIPIPCPKRD
ncbi:MAG: hypothetical protein WD066_10730 [Planctomycetaceae bacterium]